MLLSAVVIGSWIAVILTLPTDAGPTAAILDEAIPTVLAVVILVVIWLAVLLGDRVRAGFRAARDLRAPRS